MRLFASLIGGPHPIKHPDDNSQCFYGSPPGACGASFFFFQKKHCYFILKRFVFRKKQRDNRKNQTSKKGKSKCLELQKR
jgi:hypothetical protein